MNALSERLLGLAREYLGPAAPQFLTRELRGVDCTPDSLTSMHLPTLALRARASAARIMEPDRAEEFGAAVAALEPPDAPPKKAAAPGGSRAAASVPSRPALEAAASLLDQGKLRQAEEAYRQLAAKHGDAQSYHGLARAQVALEDLPAAVLTLRDGAAALTRRGDRANGIALLREAVAIAPADLAAHRRLAAAQANAGDTVGACDEYARFVEHALAEGDSRRAWLELTYARETLGDLPGLVRIVDRLMPGAPAVVQAAQPPMARPTPPPASPPPPPPPDLRRLVPAAPPAPQRIAPEDLPRTRPVGAPSAMIMADARTLTSVALEEAPIDLLARTAPRGKAAGAAAPAAAKPARKPAKPLDVEAALALLPPGGTGEQSAGIAAMRATILIGARDGRATQAALDAAKRLLALHKLQAASDLLLDYIGAGFTDREAQRLLIEVDCGIGKREIARDKCRLLGEAYRLDGRTDTADDVERLAAII